MYYTKEGYNALSANQKKELASKRLKRGHKPGAKDSKTKAGGKAKGKAPEVIRNLKAVNRQVSQLAKQMSKAVVDDDESTASSTHSGSSVEETKKAKSGSNRTNASLTRQKKVTINEKK